VKKIKKIGAILWGIIYVTGGLFATILILPLIFIIASFNAIKK